MHCYEKTLAMSQKNNKRWHEQFSFLTFYWLQKQSDNDKITFYKLIMCRVCSFEGTVCSSANTHLQLNHPWIHRYKADMWK